MPASTARTPGAATLCGWSAVDSTVTMRSSSAVEGEGDVLVADVEDVRARGVEPGVAAAQPDQLLVQPRSTGAPAARCRPGVAGNGGRIASSPPARSSLTPAEGLLVAVVDRRGARRR